MEVCAVFFSMRSVVCCSLSSHPWRLCAGVSILYRLIEVFWRGEVPLFHISIRPGEPSNPTEKVSDNRSIVPTKVVSIFCATWVFRQTQMSVADGEFLSWYTVASPPPLNRLIGPGLRRTSPLSSSKTIKTFNRYSLVFTWSWWCQSGVSARLAFCPFCEPYNRIWLLPIILTSSI